MKKIFQKSWIKKPVMLLLFPVFFGIAVCVPHMSSAAISDENNIEKTEVRQSVTAEEEDFSVIPTAEESEKSSGEKAAAYSALPGSTKAAAAVYTAWFDGTLGLGTTNSLVKNATNVQKTSNSNGVIVTPTSAGTNSKYRLKGWYDIRSGVYVKAGDPVTLTENTVFYADWVLADYDLTPSNANNVVTNQPDVSSFVRTDVFDYNELFNISHGAGVSVSFYNNNHQESWRDTYTSQNPSFLFTNWYNENLTTGSRRSLGHPANLRSERNTFNEDSPYAITKKIVTGHNDPLIQDLFDTSSPGGSGRHYLGRGKQLFQFDHDGSATGSRGFGEGYYYYDSDYNGADYNQSEERFYVYKTTQLIQGENRSGSSWVNGDRKPGFMPFEQGTVKEKTGQTNYWFGMKTQVDFFLPDDVGSNNGNCNQSTANKDMRFYFSGDDDVWVFVDDTLVLDLGGIHERIAGDINFSTGVITYYQSNGSILTTDSTTLKGIKSGDHKLTIYYLERGSSWSNCSIYFNLSPRYELEIVKEDGNTHELLANAEFSVYKDEACTVPELLWDSASAFNGGESPKNHFQTNANGKINIYGLHPHRTYYIKETDSPLGYPSISDKVIKLSLDSAGNASLQSGSDFAVISGNNGTRIGLKIENKKPEKTSVEVQKNWYDENGNPITEDMPDTVSVQLYRKAFPASSEPGGGGESGEVSLPVNFSVQYFGGGHGSNTDTSPLSAKTNLHNMIVLSGGTIRFDLNIQRRNYNSSGPTYAAGIYSVTVNGRALSPVSSSGNSGQNCFMHGRWGNYPPLRQTYEIENIDTAQDIVITLIGYMNYKNNGNSGVDSVEDTLALSATAIAPPPAEPSNPGGNDPVIVPGVKPDDAEVCGEPVILSRQNLWHHVWTDLDSVDENGDLYYYYVEETPIEGYSTSYAGNGVINGTVTVTNVRLRSIVVQKIWKNQDGTEMTAVEIEENAPAYIDGKLIQEDLTAHRSKEIDFRLTKEQNWIKKWRCDSDEFGEQEGHSYRYSVSEVEIEGYSVEYINNDGIDEGRIEIVNQKDLFFIHITKTDEKNSQMLKGASFSLYTDVSCDEEYLVEAYRDETMAGTKETVFTTDENGTVSVYGLREGTYYLKEISAPKGYLLITKAQGFTLSNSGIITLAAGGTDDFWSVCDNGITINVKNAKIYELPSTGGTGTYPFTACGVFVIVTAMLLLKFMRKEGIKTTE